jgi:hypothetical protein
MWNGEISEVQPHAPAVTDESNGSDASRRSHAQIARDLTRRYAARGNKIAGAEIDADDRLELIRRIPVSKAEKNFVARKHMGAPSVRQFNPLVLSNLANTGKNHVAGLRRYGASQQALHVVDADPSGREGALGAKNAL